MPTLEQEGRFRGRIIEYGLNEAQSGAKCVYVVLAIDEMYDPDSQEWYDWSEHDMKVGGSIWVVKRDGTLNMSQVKALVEHAGWDGKFTSVQQGSWRPTPCQVTVGEDEYEGQVRYRIEWINGFDADPSGGGNVDAKTAASLDQQFGSSMRALAGNASRNASTPASSKPKRPAPTPASAPAPESRDPSEADVDEPPF